MVRVTNNSGKNNSSHTAVGQTHTDTLKIWRRSPIKPRAYLFLRPRGGLAIERAY